MRYGVVVGGPSLMRVKSAVVVFYYAAQIALRCIPLGIFAGIHEY